VKELLYECFPYSPAGIWFWLTIVQQHMINKLQKLQ